MAFHEVRFPTRLSLGAVGGPERRTDIVTLSNGFEERNTPWAHSRRRYDAGVGMRSLDDVAELVAFFEARAGRLHGFRWKDWSDYKSCAPSGTPAFRDQVIGIGDGVQVSFNLTKNYSSGGGDYVRPIAKPVVGSVRAGIQEEEFRDTIHYEVDHATGVVTFATAPERGAEVMAGFEFDVPVRFESDAILTSVAGFQSGEVPDVPVVELRV